MDTNAGTSKKSKHGVNSLQERTFNVQPVQNRRQVEFSNRVHIQESNGVGNGFMNRNYHYPTEEQSTLTDSKDIRETEINFLNNDLTRDLESKKFESLGCHLTRVNVTVPGSTGTTNTVKYSDAGHKKGGISGKTQTLGAYGSPDMDGRMSDMSNSDGESVQNRKFKAIKNIDPGWFVVFFSIYRAPDKGPLLVKTN